MIEALEKAGVNGLISGAAAAAIFGTQATVIAPMTNMTMPLYALIFLQWHIQPGLGGVGSSIITDGLHLFMKEEVPISKKANDRTSVIAGLAVNAIIFTGLLELSAPDIAADFGRMTALGVGAGAEFAAASSYTYLKEKMYI